MRAFGAFVSRDQSTPQSVPSSASYDTTISWTTEEFDSAGMFDAGTPTVLTVQQAGVYLFSATGGFVANATNDRACALFKNGTEQLQSDQGRAPAVYFWGGNVVAVDEMAVGDTIQLKVAQNSGGNLNTGDCWLSALGFASA